ncbi:serine hydrolase domain-containing protein [Konateibacter massiliensis]|uniref:serine hydrolase domain-containing protein n=1 Tax=Konateibacter massiliensis TaxID=2002841 RepID=UPI000C14A614|nr:serine hydrolase domain-containing protein [Konateibacter massiliensis]
MRGTKKGKIKILIRTIIVLIVCIAIAVAGLSLYGKYQLSKVPKLSFKEALEYTTKENKNAVITVGIVENGITSYTVYGENGAVLPAELHTYEVGSLTKTMTAALISKAVEEERISLEDTIDTHLDLPGGRYFPTIIQLLTHTSGYKAYYFKTPMINNFFTEKNDFYGITDEMLINRIKSTKLKNQEYSFQYSNFGYAILGLVLEEIYDKDYTDLLNEYMQEEVGLTATGIADNRGDLNNYWDWKDDDAYMSAGAVTSDIVDMLSYLNLQMKEEGYFKRCHESLKKVNKHSESYETMGIRMDEIAMAWIIDTDNNIVWHNGGTSEYNCYMGFNVKTQTGVVILSNLSPNYRIPATVLGIKLLEEIQ